MKVTLELKVKPFNIPNFVVEEVPDSGTDGRSIPISSLDAPTLAALCEEFTRQVFERAGKQRPPTIRGA